MWEEVYQLFKNPPSEKDWQRFIKNVKIGTWKECWEWTGLKTKENWTDKGYGSIRMFKRSNVKAHRIMAMWLHGMLPRELVCDHIWCNNPPCVNPLHIIPTTHKGNVVRKGAKSWSAIHSQKEKCPYGHEYTSRIEMGRKRRRCMECFRKQRMDRYYKERTDPNYTERVERQREQDKLRQRKYRLAKAAKEG